MYKKKEYLLKKAVDTMEKLLKNEENVELLIYARFPMSKEDVVEDEDGFIKYFFFRTLGDKAKLASSVLYHLKAQAEDLKKEGQGLFKALRES